VTRLYVVRHGRATAGWNIDPDPALDDVGRQQAVVAAERLAPEGPLAIVSSPMRRCRQTAEPLARTSLIDLAAFDINGAGCNIRPIAEIVAARGLPFIFVSGYGPAGRPALFADKPVLHKPFLIEHFADMINLAIGDKSKRQ